MLLIQAWLLSYESESNFLVHGEGEDAAHGVEHLQLDGLRALRVNVVDEELIDDASIDHELQSFIVFLDLLYQVLRIPLDLGSLSLALRHLVLESLAFTLEGHDLVLKRDGLAELVLHAANLCLQRTEELFVFEPLSIETPRGMIMLLLLLLQGSL